MNYFFKREGLTFVGLIFTTLIFLYFAFPSVQLIFFLILLASFYYSKNDYFWLAYFAVVIFETGGFFARDLILGFGAVPLSLVFMVSMTFVLKRLRKINHVVLLVHKHLRLWIIYMLVLLIIGILIYGLGDAGKSGLRYYFFVAIFVATTPVLFAIPRYFEDYNFLVNFSKLIFIAIFINLVGQIIHIAVGNPVFLIFKPDLTFYGEGLMDIEFGSHLIRPIWGHWICFLGIFLALFFQIRDEGIFSRSFLYTIIFVSYISIFIGATRGWILSFSFIIFTLPFVFSTSRNIGIVLKFFFGSLIFIVMLYSFSSSFRIQADLVFERLTTLELLVEGDVTAGGTNARLTERHDKVFDVFKESPVFGKGISSSALDVNDSHVGNQNMLMEGGIIGFLINLSIWISIVLMALRYHFKSKGFAFYKQELLVVVIIFIALFLIHSTSSAVFGYLVLIKHPDKFLFVSIVIGIANSMLNENRREVFLLLTSNKKKNQ